VRLLASCDSRVDTANESGTLANELCERLNARIVRVPPLRARAEDIEPLVRHYLTVFNRELGKRVERVSQDAVGSLEAYTWPGNIRELRMVVERAVLAADGDRLEAADFALPTISRRSSAEMDLPPSGVNLERLERNLVIQALQRTGGNQTRAATLLGLNRDQVRYRIEKFGLTRN
jgi:DNA-binding NtrC family response regulator